MSSSKILAVWVLFCLGSVAAAEPPADRLAAARVLGPHWRAMSRTAGMVFTGTVLKVESHTSKDDAIPTIRLTFKVGRAIAGVHSGQILTVREWAGACMHRPMHVGDHLLLFLYRPSKLGLTSPVSGRFGQVALDATGTHVTTAFAPSLPRIAPSTPDAATMPTVPQNITVLDLERAIRAAREE